MTDSSPGVQLRVAAVVLAAGESRRMGRPKLALPYGDSTIVETVIETVRRSMVSRIILVAGHHLDVLQPLLQNLEVSLVVNPLPDRGMLSSAQSALDEIPDVADAYLFVLGDQPQIQTDTVNALVASAERSAKGIFLPVYEGKRGHPLLIRARYRADILVLPDSTGLNTLVRANAGDVEEVSVDSPTVLKDIDTPDDYAEAIRQTEPHA